MERHAAYATCDTPEGPVSFRIGQPTDWNTAIKRWTRLEDQRRAGRRRIHYMRRKYPVRFFELRSTDRHGRGLGSERHATAIILPYRAYKVAGK